MVFQPADTTPPAVPTGLTATAVSTSRINLQWNASTDNVGVAGYKIFRNGTQIATSTVTTYANTGLVAGTAYTYTVSAYDAAGNNSEQSQPATAITQSVFGFSLSNGGNISVVRGLAGSSVITATLVSGTAASVTFTLAGLPAGATASFNPTACVPACTSILTITTSATTPIATRTITITGTGGPAKTTTQLSLIVSADTTPPAVSLTAPAAGTTVATSVPVSATAADNVAVSGVQFAVDGVALGSKITAAPYSISWDTTATSNGAHTLTAIATDTSGNSATSAPVSVTVSNALPTLTVQLSGDGTGTVSGGGITCGSVCSAR